MSKARVLLVGWDAADWRVIEPLLAAREMPNLARMIAGGVRGNLATIYPVLSPMLWTSIATGKRAYKHGIHGFSEPLPNAQGVRPITLLGRKTKAVWNILNQTGYRSFVVGWWPSHPAEPLNGVMVSNHFAQPAGEPGAMPPLLLGTVHPASLSGSLGELRVNPMELTGDFIRLFVPEYEKVDQKADKRLHILGKTIAETMSVHAVATELLGAQDWDFAALYYSGLDHFQHSFMRYHPPRLPWVGEEEFGIYQSIISNAYRYHDAMLGTLLGLAGEETTVVLMSDHGFHPDHLRAGYIPAEPAGPAVEHRHYGIVCMNGPGLRVNERVYGASLLDICPTILTMFGLQPGKDMDGKVLVTVFKEPPVVSPIESWDKVAGNAGMHPADAQVDAAASALAFQQLVDLGYVAPPGQDVAEAVAESVRELKYNLARAYRDGDRCGEAAGLAEELWGRWPKEHRFGILLVDCLGALRRVARRREVIEELARRIELYQGQAKEELARREEQKQREPKKETPSPLGEPTREQFLERQWRELANGRPLLIDWLLVTQALMERKPADARRHLAKLTGSGTMSEGLSRQVAAALTQLGDLEAARELFEAALKLDSDNASAHAQLAEVHFKSKRFGEAIASATESLSLLYFQPVLHALLGRALMQTRRYAEAEQALRVAVSQSPRNLAAHEFLGRLYRQHLNRPEDAFAEEGRARSLRHELSARRRAGSGAGVGLASGSADRAEDSQSDVFSNDAVPPPFGSEIDPRGIITVVSG